MGPFLGFMPTKGISTQGENEKGGTGMYVERAGMYASSILLSSLGRVGDLGAPFLFPYLHLAVVPNAVLISYFCNMY